MATYAVSFRVENTGNYSERYSSIVETIRKENTGEYHWEETTSFFLIQSIYAPDTVASSIYAKSLMDASKDKLLVINVQTGQYATRGKIEYPALLAAVMPPQ